MIRRFQLPLASVALSLAMGCASTPQNSELTTQPIATRAQAATQTSAIIPASQTEPAVSTVEDLVRVATDLNPRLRKAQHLIEAAQGNRLQAGLYPNPTLDILGDELGDRTGPGGIWTAPKFSQEIVTGRKLTLAQAVAAREVDQATLDLLRERYAVVGAVRLAFYDAYTLERRVQALDTLVKLSADAVKFGQALLDNKQIARLDLVQLEVEYQRLNARAEAARRELPHARKQLAAAIGARSLTIEPLQGPFEELPVYDADRTLASVLASHPELRSAQVGVERAKAAVRSAEAQVIPNVTLSTGYTRQNQNVSNDWLVGFSVPLPTWNRNQGAIRAAQAEQLAAVQEVSRIENDLTDRTAAALRAYASAYKEAELYRKELLPRAEETYRLSVEAFRGGQFEYLRVIQAQRSIAEAKLDYTRALGDAWKAAAQLSALLLEDYWPGTPPDLKPATPAPAK